MLESLHNTEQQALSELQQVAGSADMKEWRSRHLGKESTLMQNLGSLGSFPAEERPAIGRRANEIRRALEAAYHERSDELGSTTSEAALPTTLDVTLPGRPVKQGRLHIATQTLRRIYAIWAEMGFQVYRSQDLETDEYNFELLNIPAHHPARDMQDTFFIDRNTVLRTHTSNVQIHLMESMEPPLKYIVPGRVYRNEAISYKSYCLFHQVEGLYINKNVSFSELKGTLEYFIHSLFGTDTKIRFRPSFFPFTEPSAEVDLWDEERSQWMEILGCGMVDPQVLNNVGYDPVKWDGYAFGLGIERMAMLKYKINDIRLFYQNDLRFLDQF